MECCGPRHRVGICPPVGIVLYKEKVSYSLNSLMGGYIGDYTGEYSRAYSEGY